MLKYFVDSAEPRIIYARKRSKHMRKVICIIYPQEYFTLKLIIIKIFSVE